MQNNWPNQILGFINRKGQNDVKSMKTVVKLDRKLRRKLEQNADLSAERGHQSDCVEL